MNNQQRLETYLALCTEYYDLDKPKAPTGALQFYLKYADEAQGPILEPMCGTGMFLVPLLEQGLPIEGFDASPFMLDRLRKKCGAKNIKPIIWDGWLEEMGQQDQYALIFIASASMALIIDLENVKKCIEKIYRALHLGGKFVFDIQTLQAIPQQLNIWKGNLRHYIDGRKILLSTLDLPLEDNVRTTLCRYDLIDNNVIIKTEIENFRIRLHDPHELSYLLKEIGFKNIKIMKPFNHNKKPEKNDETVIFECQK